VAQTTKTGMSATQPHVCKSVNSPHFTERSSACPLTGATRLLGVAVNVSQECSRSYVVSSKGVFTFAADKLHPQVAAIGDLRYIRERRTFRRGMSIYAGSNVKMASTPSMCLFLFITNSTSQGITKSNRHENQSRQDSQ
jgi:hypothetical protein